MDVSQHKCPNCDGEMSFNPETQMIQCDFCRSTFTVQQIQELYPERPTEQQTGTTERVMNDAGEFEAHTNLYQCTTCGAEIMSDDETAATFCYYCHSPVILSGRLSGQYRPDKVIGFRITRDNAVSIFKNWCGSKMFIPKSFKSEQQLEKMTGLYVPFWLADCNVSADYHATGKHVKHWTSGNYRYTETKEFNVERSARFTAKGIPADGASKIEDALMEAIEPFNYEDMTNFSMSYLTGFYADKFDVDKPQVFPRIRERAAEAGRKIMRESVSGYSSVVVHHETYNINRTDWKYAMLPVWFMSYKYNDKVYEFVINGQTGKVAGTPPLDKKKLTLFSFLMSVAVTALVFIGGQFLI